MNKRVVLREQIVELKRARKDLGHINDLPSVAIRLRRLEDLTLTLAQIFEGALNE